jgi:hypothetical protein
MQSATDARGHFSHELHHFAEAGDEVMVDIVLHARAQLSGLSLSRPEWGVWTIRAGTAVRVEWCRQKDAALRFAGLADASGG